MNRSTQQQEVWLPIAGYEGLYEVSDLGRVRSLDRKISAMSCWGTIVTRKKRGKILAPRKRCRGYVAVQLGRGAKDSPIHHLVLEAFSRKRRQGEVANHINSIKTDNRIENLEWCTAKENMRHAIKNGIMRRNTGQRWSLFSKKEVLEIRAEYGKTLSRDLAARYGVNQMTISRVGLRKTYKKYE